MLPLDQLLLCPRCAAPLPPTLTCPTCAQHYPRLGRIPVLLPRPDDHVILWRRQLALLISQANHTSSAFIAAAAAAATTSPNATTTAPPSPATHSRLHSLAAAVTSQLDDLLAVVTPALTPPLPPTSDTGLPRGVVENLSFLHRDWAWDSGASPENQRSLAAIRSVATPAPLGRTLVLGAGGCRLAYDLHLDPDLAPTDTVVVDIDPFLFLVAEAVVRGASVRLTESSPGVQHLARVATTWTLRAPAGPLDDARFHFFLANGLAPPFAPGTFDTVVTPWFIDQVPPELPAFLATVNRLLRPGGRWLNHGPLVYPPDVPFARKYSAEEVFDLVARAGFAVGRTAEASHPHLVSPLTGRGKVEWVLTFVASKVGEPGG